MLTVENLNLAVILVRFQLVARVRPYTIMVLIGQRAPNQVTEAGRVVPAMVQRAAVAAHYITRTNISADQDS